MFGLGVLWQGLVWEKKGGFLKIRLKIFVRPLTPGPTKDRIESKPFTFIIRLILILRTKVLLNCTLQAMDTID